MRIRNKIYDEPSEVPKPRRFYWEPGDDYKEDDADYKTYGITYIEGDYYHTNAIEVYISGEVRDFIVKVLNEKENEFTPFIGDK